MPDHAVVREIGERMAERRKLPVKNPEYTRLGYMKHQVFEAIVAVNDGRALVGRDVLRQPRDQGIHRGDRIRFRRLVLASPQPNLARHVAAWLAERAKTHRARIDGMEP